MAVKTALARLFLACVLALACGGWSSAAVSGTITSATYTGSGTTGPFSVPFVFIAPSDLRLQTVNPAGAVTTLTYSTDYSVAGGAIPYSTQPLTGTVTLTVALATGYTLTIDRGNMPPTQPLVLTNGGPVQATALSGAYDRGALIAQQVGSVAARSVQFPVGDTASPLLPVASVRAGGFVSFDSSGNATVTQTAPGVAPASWFNVKTYGAVGNGIADDTVAIQAAINAVGPATGVGVGGVVYLPGGIYKVTATLVVSNSNTVIQGAGGADDHDGGRLATIYGTKIQWAGGASPVITFMTPNDTTIARKTGMGLRDVWIDGNATATIGVSVTSIRKSTFDNLHVSNVVGEAYFLNSYTSAGYAESMDCQENVFSRLTWRMIDTSPVQSATGVVVTTASPTTDTANVSYNEFHLCSGQTYGAPGIQIANGDNNTFQGCRAFVVGTGIPGLLLQGQSTACDYNVFMNCQFSAAGSGAGSGFIKIEGTNSGWPWSPRANTFFCMDDSNATVFPTMDASCDCQFHTSGGGWQRQRMYTGVATVGGLLVSTYVREVTGTAAPTTKTWGVGDRCRNLDPVVGQPKAWVCTVAGTPGTWVSEGNL